VRQPKTEISIAQFREMAKKGIIGGKKKMARPEQDLQIKCVSWFRVYHPTILAFHVPNGFKVNKGAKRSGTAGIIKAMGGTPGVADLLVIKSSGSFIALAVEFKSDKGTQSEYQKIFQGQWEAWGGKYIIVNSFEIFQREILCYFQAVGGTAS
jgi:hypothetical protein